MAELHIIEAEVLGTKNSVHRLKVSILDLGLYMFGFRVSKSDRNPSGWWVQAPATMTKVGWKTNPEFDKKLTLWSEIELSCINAVTEHCSQLDTVYTPEDSEINPESIEESLNKAIPWMNEEE